MGSEYQDAIRLWHPLPIKQGESTVVFEQGTTSGSIDILSLARVGSDDEQTVWYASTGSFDNDRPQFITLEHFFARLSNELSGQFAGTYEFQSFSPNSHLSDTGLKLVQTSQSESFSWRFDDPNWTLDPRILGFDEDRSAKADSSSFEIAPPYSYIGAQHFDARSVPPAKDFRGVPDSRVFRSSIDRRYGYANEWTPQAEDPSDRDQDFGIFRNSKIRRISLQHVGIARILNHYADDSFEADRAGVSQGDKHTSIDHFWRYSEIGPLFVDMLWTKVTSGLHNLELREINDGTAEIASLHRTAQIRRLRDAVEDAEDGQTHNVDLPVRLGADTVDH